jgi:hypothetical protein
VTEFDVAESPRGPAPCGTTAIATQLVFKDSKEVGRMLGALCSSPLWSELEVVLWPQMKEGIS